MKKNKLYDLIKVKRGGSLDGEHYALDGDVIRLTLANFYEKGGFKESNFERNIFYNGEIKKGDLLEEGTLITPLTEQVHGLLGSIARIPESNKYIPCGDIGIIDIIDTNKIDENYLFYFFQTEYARKQLIRGAQKSKIRHINANDFYNISVDLPSIENQKLIGSFLHKIDQVINNNNKAINEISFISKTLYSYWFLQFDFPDKNGKPYKSSGGKMKFSKKLNTNIPESWDVKNLAKNPLTKLVKTGVDKFTKKNYLSTSEINNTDITDGVWLTYDERPSRANMQPDFDTVWFAKMKNSIKHIFLSDNCDYFLDKYILSTGMVGLKCKKSAFSYIASYVANENFEKIKDKVSSGATQEAINNDELKFFSLLIPDESILDKYDTITRPIYRYQNKLFQENQELLKLKEFLLPLLMNDQVSIKDKGVINSNN